MYIPHFDALLHALGSRRDQLGSNSTIEIPVPLLKLMLQLALANGEFNATGYLAANRDIQDAVKNGQIADPKAHYTKFGFFEGRRGAAPAVDEVWYRRTYSDIGAAVRKGSVASGADHFNTIGAEEFRAPSASYLADALEWKKAVGKG